MNKSRKKIKVAELPPDSLCFRGTKYFISPSGQVYRRVRTGFGYIYPSTGYGGYLKVNIYAKGNGSKTSIKVHIIQAEVSLGPKPAGMVVRHLNDVRTDNRRANIAYGTQAQNVREGRLREVLRARRGRRKLTSEQVGEIRSSALGYKALATQFGLTRESIRNIKIGKTYKDVPM